MDRKAGPPCPDRWGVPRRALAAALLLPLLGATAAFAVDDRDLSDFDHRRWTSREGFTGQVSAIAQTTDGFLWLATGQSLYRFDGLELDRFRSADGGHLPAVSALAAHPDGSLWVGLRHGGLVRLNGAQATRFAAAQGIPSGIPFDLKVDADGSLLVAIADQLVAGNEHGWQTVDLPGSGHDPRVRSVFVDRDGGAWVGGAHLWHRPPGSDRYAVAPGDAGGIVGIAQAPDGRVWVAESDPVRIRPIHPAHPGSTPGPELPHPATTIAFDGEGGLWIGTPGEGLLFAPAPDRSARPRTTAFADAHGLSGEFVGASLTDREGNLWFGTSAGLDRFRQSYLARVGFPSGAHNFALAIDAGNRVWAGSLNRPALWLAGRSLTQADVPPPVTVAQPARDGGVWLAGPHGVWKSDGTAIARRLELPDGIAAPANVRALVEDGDGTVWASIDRAGLYRWHGEAWHLEAPHGGLPSQRMPVRAIVDGDGTPWFGYRDNLLVNVRPGHTRTWGPAEGLDVGHVTALLFTGGHRWIGGTTGLSRFDGNAFIPVAFADGVRVSGIHGLVATVTGELWLHGNEGVVRIDADQIARVLADPGHRIRPRQLGPIEHLADDTRQLRPLPTTVTGVDGHVWIATSSGVRRVDPRRVAEGEAPPPAHIVSIRGDDDRPQAAGSAILPPMTRRVAIAYTASGLKYPESVRFRYRLAGHDRAWSESATAREVSYFGLSPGAYAFELAAAYGDGRWSVPTSATFRVRPALHQTNLFIVLCAIAAALAAIVAYQLRVRRLAATLRERLEERHRERERIARELHDTLLQSVQGLMLRFQAACQTLPPDEPARRAIESALDRADQVMAEGRDRVSDLRLHDPKSGELMQALSAVGHELAEQHGVRFRSIAQGHLQPLPGPVHDELFRIAREALINAFRHASANEIELELNSDRAGLRLHVRDDGKGIPAALLQGPGKFGHWGLAGMRERAARIGAGFELWSREGTGTEVEIHLPRAARPARGERTRGWRNWWFLRRQNQR